MDNSVVSIPVFNIDYKGDIIDYGSQGSNKLGIF